MLVQFKDISFDQNGNVDAPVLVLKHLNGDAIGILGNCHDLNISLRYNDVSELSFALPASSDSSPTPFYEEVQGMRLIEIEPYGNFILMNPKRSSDGLRESKLVTGYSLEYEFSSKNIFLPSGTYNFWNPADKENTVLHRIMERMPNWSIGQVDSALLGKYRTFDLNETNLFSFMMNTLQQSYHCFFLFDTKNRIVHVKDAAAAPEDIPVFLSFDNLIKHVEVEEQTDGLVTCLSAYGADPVTIRTVNPTGTNKLYNLDYFMRNGSFRPQIVKKWADWKDNFDRHQALYGRINTAYSMRLSDLAIQKARLTQLQEELWALEEEQSAQIEAISAGRTEQSALQNMNRRISEKKTEIRKQEETVERASKELEVLTNEKKEINQKCSFSAFFTEEEIRELDLYCKEDTLQDTTFVLSNYHTYTDGDFNHRIEGGAIAVLSEQAAEIETETDTRLFDFKNGTLQVTGNGSSLSGEIVKITVELNPHTKEFLLSAFLNQASVNDAAYPSANLSAKGTHISLSTEGGLHFIVEKGMVFLTRSVTEYQQMLVEQELYDYARSCLQRISEPSYRFSVECGNFLFLKEFAPFRDALALGKTITLALEEDKVIHPILTGIHIDYEKPNNYSMVFSDNFRSSDSEFKLVDLLGQAVTTASHVDFSKYNYSAFQDSGASTQVKEFIHSALDVSKNAILSSSNQDVSWDSSGIHLRRSSAAGYAPEEIRMINNCIALTNDNWNSAKLAIGKFTDKNLGECWGVAAPNIAGTLLAGENLVIESRDPQGNALQFKVDGSGAYLNNARFLTSQANTQVAIDPQIGLAIGRNPLYTVDKNSNRLSLNTENASLFTDPNGNLTMKGNVYATDGVFTGTVYANSGTFKGTIQAEDFLDRSGKSMLTSHGKLSGEYLDLMGVNVLNDSGEPVFRMDQNGIDWNVVNSDPKMTNKVNTALNKAADAQNELEHLIENIGYTKIGKTYVISPTICSNKFDVRPKDKIYNGSFNIYGYFNNYSDEPAHVFRLNYYKGDYPMINFGSPYGAYAEWNFNRTNFSGYLNFSNATIEGLVAKFG